jgi:iron complex transport system ATP-binding protein
MLRIRNLTCGYGNNPILNNINVTIEDGEFTAIIGPNGSGKTTLLRAISGIISPTAGEILFEGRNISGLSRRDIAKRLAVVTNLIDTNLEMSVEDFVLLGRIPHREGIGFTDSRKDVESARNAMARTDVERLRDRLVTRLSSGERQLVFIARALAQEPVLLLLDEPTSHLDITHQVRVLDLIKRLNCEQGLTVITILHDLNLAGQYADRLLLLNNGSIYKDGDPREVLTYQNIEEAYKTLVVVRENPVNEKPYVFLISESERNKTDI